MMKGFAFGVVLCLLFLQVQGSFIVNQFTGCSSCAIDEIVSVSEDVVLLLTADDEDAGLYRSQDAGVSWTQLGYGVMWFESYDDPNTFVFLNRSSTYINTFYVSRDGGATITTGATFSTANTIISSTTVHPSEPGWMFSILTNSTGSWLIYSQDYGMSWTDGMRVGRTGPAFWSLDPNYPEIIFLTTSVNGALEYGFTVDYQTSGFTPLFSQALNSAVFETAWMTPNFHYVLTRSGKRVLYVSHGPSSYYSPANYQPATLNYTASPTPVYTFLDDSNYVAIVGLVFGTGSTWGPVFVSDSSGQQFTQSLPFVAGSVDGRQTNYFDIRPVSVGLMGMYLANYYIGGNQQYGRHSRISYNAGRSWSLIPAPLKNAKGQPTNCSIADDCSLNLCVKSYGEVPGFYTASNDVGMIIANGNIGSALLMKPEGMATFLSNDAGFSWSEIYPEPTIAATGDNQDILFASYKATTTVMYSTNNGASYSTFTFTLSPLRIENIYSIGGSTFIVNGLDPKNLYQIFVLDFSTVNMVPSVSVKVL